MADVQEPLKTRVPPEQSKREPTPLELADLEEAKKPFLEKFRDLVDELAKREEQGISPTRTLVDGFRALYDQQVAEHGGTKPVVADKGAASANMKG